VVIKGNNWTVIIKNVRQIMRLTGKLLFDIERGDIMGKVVYLFKGEKQMKREITDIAKVFLYFESMTHKKLQKLCYYAQALHLATNNEPLVDAEFQAWVHGPVCPELYQEYKEYGAFGIRREEYLPTSIPVESYEYAFIKSIYNRYKHLSGNELEALTHTEDPWINARKGLNYWQPSINKISEKEMINYYQKKRN